MSRVSRREWYSRVNAAWPSNVPVLDADEQVKIARRMYRFITGQTWTGDVKLTSGNRYAWIRNRTLFVNPEQPIECDRGLVHLLSHYFHRRLNPGIAPHSGAHARIEIKMIKEIVKRGYLTGALKTPERPEPAPATPADRIAGERAKLEAGLKRWSTKKKRAETAIRKITRRLRHLAKKSSTAAATA